MHFLRPLKYSSYKSTRKNRDKHWTTGLSTIKIKPMPHFTNAKFSSTGCSPLTKGLSINGLLKLQLIF